MDENGKAALEPSIAQKTAQDDEDNERKGLTLARLQASAIAGFAAALNLDMNMQSEANKRCRQAPDREALSYPDTRESFSGGSRFNGAGGFGKSQPMSAEDEACGLMSEPVDLERPVSGFTENE